MLDEASSSSSFMKQWIDAVVVAAHQPPAFLDSWRHRMKAHARQTYLWSIVAGQWHTIFSDELIAMQEKK
jgi:hypothetical protein